MKLSVRAQVTVWYTGLLLLLLSVGVLYLFSFSDRLSIRQLRETLADVVTDAVKGAQFHHGELDDEDIDFYRDGVSLFLYDTKGRLLAPKVNRGIQVDSILEDQTVRTVDSAGEKWLVYDIYAVQDNTPFWTRGVISLSGPQGTLRRMMLVALIGVPIFVFVAALGGWLITRRVFSAMGRMAATADAITSGSDLSLRVDADGQDEFSRLGRTINSMLERLQNAFERERQFTSDVSHELRTPATVIISQCEFALSGKATEGERENALYAVLRQAQRMSAMIAQLLLLARAENGRFIPRWEQVDMSELCEMVQLEMDEQAGKIGVTVTGEISPGILIEGDETLLIRMTVNLLSNAIRYNRPGGRVTLGLEEESGNCIVTVSDTGIGIRAEELGRIWDRFYRVDRSRSSEGTGLGLSLVQWIVRIHGGKAEVVSVFGEGSRFIVTLPKTNGKHENF